MGSGSIVGLSGLLQVSRILLYDPWLNCLFTLSLLVLDGVSGFFSIVFRLVLRAAWMSGHLGERPGEAGCLLALEVYKMLDS